MRTHLLLISLPFFYQVAISNLWSAGGNAAGLAFHKKTGGGLYAENRFLMKELMFKGAVAALPLKAGTFGLTATSFGNKLYSESKYGLSFAKSFGPSFAASVQIDYLHTKIAEGYGRKGTAVAEAGVFAKPLKGLNIAAHIFNPTHTRFTEHERIPTIVKLGAAYHFSPKLVLAAETEKSTEWPKGNFKAGIEYSPMEPFRLRGGLNTLPSLIYFGFGYCKERFGFDAASSLHAALGPSFHLSMQYEWD